MKQFTTKPKRTKKTYFNGIQTSYPSWRIVLIALKVLALYYSYSVRSSRQEAGIQTPGKATPWEEYVLVSWIPASCRDDLILWSS